MAHPYRVFLTEWPKSQWPEDDRAQIREALLPTVRFTESIREAEIIHGVCWESLTSIKSQGSPVLCQVTGEPQRLWSHKKFRRLQRHVDLWVAQSDQDYQQMREAGARVEFVPYTVDTSVFRRVNPDELRSFWKSTGVPTDKYLIGSFQQDTDFNLKTPLSYKGPERFAQIVTDLHRDGQPIHVVLAGPRRYWLIDKLRENGVPFTFVGKELRPRRDDVGLNTLAPPLVNLLYNVIDLYVVASASESGPRAVLEASAAETKIISTRVGHAPAVLSPSCLYDTGEEAVDIIRVDIADRRLKYTTREHLAVVRRKHSPETAQGRFEQIYQQIDSL